jgi:hypothetical protein
MVKRRHHCWATPATGTDGGIGVAIKQLFEGRMRRTPGININPHSADGCRRSPDLS